MSDHSMSAESEKLNIEHDTETIKLCISVSEKEVVATDCLRIVLRAK